MTKSVLKHLEFLKKFKNLQPALFNEVTIIGQFECNKSFILVNTKYGVCKSTPNTLYKGGFPSIKTAINKTEYFINQAREVHRDLYDYSLVNYEGGHSKVKIISSEGVFEQTPSKHLQGRGCPYIKNKNISIRCKKSKKDFVKESINKHGDKYDYSMVDYINNKIKVKIICKEHGDFEQNPSVHLQGSGCPKCGRLITTQYSINNPIGWSYTNWINAANKSKKFDSFKVYVIKCWNDTEVFYKIGKTFKTVKRRFYCKEIMPYEYEILNVIEGDGKTICDLENRLKNLNKKNKYTPKIYFKGMYECFIDVEL